MYDFVSHQNYNPLPVVHIVKKSITSSVNNELWRMSRKDGGYVAWIRVPLSYDDEIEPP